MKLNKDSKTALILVGAFVLMIALYGIDLIYKNHTGKLETEYILPYSEVQTVSVKGFAVRDENISVDGKNTSVFYKDDSLVYVPVISDSENIAKNGVIALGFADEEQASAYIKEVEMREKLSNIKETAGKTGLNHNNVVFLNSQISSLFSKYIKSISSGNISDADSLIDTIESNITTRQSAIGEDVSYDMIIDDYTKQINQLKASYSIKKKITSPYAGYFISNVDGYESAVSYDDVSKKKVENGSGALYRSVEQTETENAYGKLIAQHTWYYVFDIDVSHASVIRPGYWVSVAFEELGIHDVDMLVYDISDDKDGIITVTLKCTSMNENLAKIRKDPAEITVKKYSGFKISNEAISENETGVVGVYVIVGNIMKFAPIEVLYYSDGYVIANGVAMLKDENDKSFGYYHKLKHYDKIIVKGVNLEDGSLIN